RLESQATTTEALAWRDEFIRYGWLSVSPWSTPARRLAVGLLLLAVAAFVLRRRSPRGRLFDLPGAVLGVAFLLRVLTPSKWPSHFGALVGVGAVAVAVETARLRFAYAQRLSFRPFLAIGAVAAVANWAWFTEGDWGPADLRSLHWDSPISILF